MQLLQRSPRSSSSIILMCYHGWQQFYYCSCTDLVLLWQCMVEHWQCHVPFPPPQQSQDKLCSFSISPPLSIHFYLSSIPSVLSALHGVCSKKTQKNNALQLPVISIDLHYLTQLSAPETARIGIWVLARCMLHSCIKKVFNAWGFAQYQPRYVFLWSLRYFFP